MQLQFRARVTYFYAATACELGGINLLRSYSFQFFEMFNLYGYSFSNCQN